MVVDDIEKGSSANYGDVIHEIIERYKAFTTCNIVHQFRNLNFKGHNPEACTLFKGLAPCLVSPARRSFIRSYKHCDGSIKLSKFD